MTRFKAELGANGTQTFVIDVATRETFCICVGEEHQENAKRIVANMGLGDRVRGLRKPRKEAKDD